MTFSTRIFKLATNFFVIFNCDNCENSIAKDIKFTNWYSTDANEAEIATDSKTIECDSCGKKFTFSISSREEYTEVIAYDLPDDYPISIYDSTYNNDELKAILSNTSFFETFTKEIENLKKIYKIQIESGYREILNRLVFIAIISTMETYFKDALINTVLRHEKFLRKFVETFENFKKEKFTLNEFFKCQNEIKEKSKKAMFDLIYHDIPKIKGIYRDTLNIDFGNIGTIAKYVSMRHDLVHRNGKTKEGDSVIVNSELIADLIKHMETFIGNINNQIVRLKSK
jgi:hypothetical protein